MKRSTLKNSLGLRLIIIAFLSLVLLIPAQMIKSLIRERQERREEAVKEVFNKWGSKQIIGGPILTIPFKSTMRTNEREIFEVKKYVHLLPEDLNITGIVTPQRRYRGIYEMVLYQAKLQINGHFNSSEIKNLSIPINKLYLEEASLSLGISDMKGIKEMADVKWNSDILYSSPGIQARGILPVGVSVKTPIDLNREDYRFDIAINLNGSEDLMFTPVGKENIVKISSPWNNPSFSGEYLPDFRQINEDGFKAEWKILYMNRNYPQKWIGDEFRIEPSKFGVTFLIPVDEYQKTMRTAKYVLMFITFTFFTFFLIELLNRRAIHPIQYLLIGFALLLFYTLLLSLSEHFRFNFAYLISSLSIIVMISAYTKAVLKSNWQVLLIFGFLSILYSYLFLILQLQDYALLMGSIVLFFILGLLMFITRGIDWFLIFKPQNTEKLSEPNSG